MAWIDSLFVQMHEAGASDLHLTSEQVARFRLHGDIVDVPGSSPIPGTRLREILYEVTPEANRDQFEKEHDTDFAYELPGKARFRGNLFMDRHGPGAVFRLIPSEVLTAEQLNLPKAAIDLCYLSKGLVVVTGPTGSGKSTTLAAMVDHMNKNRSDHIITIEDPIEFVHRNQRCLVHQREVHRHTNSFKRALRAALREDPDIVLVGEMRDLETVEIAIETAETGHLVFGTLHTTTAASTVDRIIDQFPHERQSQIRTMLSSSLKGVIAQTLCKKLPKGRVAALEILISNTAVASNIRDGKTHQIASVMQMGGKLGMRLMNDSLLELVKNRVVDPNEAYLKAVNKEDLLHRMSALGFTVDHANSLEAAGEPAAPAPSTPQPASPMPQRAAPVKMAAPMASADPHPQPHAPQHAQQHAPQHAPAPAAPAPKTPYTDPFDQFKKGKSR